MKLVFLLFGIVVLACSAQLVSAQDQTPGDLQRDIVRESEIYDRLRVVSPEAVPIFYQATKAMDESRLLEAERLYQQVLDRAPGFPDALRRLSYVQLDLGDIDGAVESARAALAADASAYNQLALARALLALDEPAVNDEALSLATKAAEALPDDLETQVLLAVAAGTNDRGDLVRQASERLIEFAPGEPAGYFFAGIAEATDGHWVVAERQLLTAKELGMSAEIVDDVLDSGVHTWATAVRWERRLLVAIVVWLVGLIVLSLAGLVLSSLTLRTVKRALDTGTTLPTVGERTVRRIYRVIVVLTAAYFYISIPFVILVVLEIVGAIFYGFLVIGLIPVRIALIIAFFAVLTLIAVVRSVFTRIRQGDPGRALTMQEAPRLWKLTQDVAQHLNTRPVDSIFIRPGAEIGVTERGGMWKRLRGKEERCLVVGLGALPGLRQRQFEAILAHEYAHLFNRDTAGGGLAGQVLASMHQMAFRLAKGGQAAPFNPAWLFVTGFYRIYLRTTLGASRLQEILADRYAATAYGAQYFIAGLTHIVRQSVVFETQVEIELVHANDAHRPLQNLYALPSVASDRKGKTIDDLVDEVINRPTSKYDSHPATIDRIHFVERLGTTCDSPDEGPPVWVLIPNRTELQLEMTSEVQKNAEYIHGLQFSS